ncbi:hypothetical protein GE253_05050 [Niveispirillum sp. SYP-B3756]|uniref:hypothetical protein n=1 Tax=Niveispirillum sp. SYP-B3756 TaxID=2662178 RepID=UPI0012916F00|nr:hypothetical protein [Niveispirillum sp. SYP-B3756]MQP64710.1 hypothetical protein [Niveispirillum sp. SYP-B3756]
MFFKDDTTIQGALILRIRRGGVLVEEQKEPNMIMDVAKDALSRLIAGDGAGKAVTAIGFGIGGVPPTPADQSLTSPYTKTLSGHTYPARGQVRFEWALSTGEANGMAIREFGLVTSDGLLFARKVRAAAIEKADDISLDGSWTIIF